MTQGGGAYEGCTSLESVTLPKNLVAIGSWAFKGCENLKTITICSKKLKSVDAISLPENTTIYVPKGRLKKYRKLFAKAGVRVGRCKWKTLKM